MSECSCCGRPSNNSDRCPTCVILKRTPTNRSGKLTIATDTSKKDRARPEARVDWRYLAGGAIIVLAILFGLRSETPRPLPAVTLAAIQGSSQTVSEACEGKPRCLVAYLTPWCPGCRASMPFVRDVSTILASTGVSAFVVIVGDGAPDEVTSMAQELGGTVYLDVDRSFKRARGFSGVPYWMVVDKDGLVVDSASSGGVSGLSPRENVRYFISQNFSDGEVARFGL